MNNCSLHSPIPPDHFTGNLVLRLLPDASDWMQALCPMARGLFQNGGYFTLG